MRRWLWTKWRLGWWLASGLIAFKKAHAAILAAAQAG